MTADVFITSGDEEEEVVGQGEREKDYVTYFYTHTHMKEFNIPEEMGWWTRHTFLLSRSTVFLDTLNGWTVIMNDAYNIEIRYTREVKKVSDKLYCGAEKHK